MYTATKSIQLQKVYRYKRDNTIADTANLILGDSNTKHKH